MLKIKSLFTSTILTLLTGGTSWAEQNETVSMMEVAAFHCPVEWNALAELEPNTWSQLNPIMIDPKIDYETTQAFNKYVISIVAIADYINSFVGLTKNQNLSFFAQAQAEYNLTMCLLPNSEERNLIVKLGQIVDERPEEEMQSILFEGMDQFLCMGFDKASEEAFKLQPLSQSFSDDFASIQTATMTVCN